MTSQVTRTKQHRGCQGQYDVSPDSLPLWQITLITSPYFPSSPGPGQYHLWIEFSFYLTIYNSAISFHGNKRRGNGITGEHTNSCFFNTCIHSIYDKWFVFVGAWDTSSLLPYQTASVLICTMYWPLDFGFYRPVTRVYYIMHDILFWMARLNGTHAMSRAW